MWSALKSDLFDFVNTIQSDTATTLQKVLGEEDEFQEEEQSLIDKLKADLKRSYETYANAVPDSKLKDYEKYMKKFSLSSFAKEIAQVLDEEPEVSRFYAELVPVEISPEEFWARLFFRLHLLNRSGSTTFVDEDEEEEELGWEAEPPMVESTKERPLPASSIQSFPSDLDRQDLLDKELRAKDAIIEDLKRENLRLQNQLRELAQRIADLERRSAEPVAAVSQSIPEDATVQQPHQSTHAMETVSVSSSEGSGSLLMISHETVRYLQEKELSIGSNGAAVSSAGKSPGSAAPLASLDDDEDDEDGWS